MNTERPTDAEVEQIIETAINLLQDGQPVDFDQLIAAHPGHAATLRELLPAVLALVQMADAPQPDATIIKQTNSFPYDRLGDFRLIREIGHGGMGTVFEAEQLSMGRSVALKVLPFATLVQDKSLQRFRNEVRAAGALDHPNIVAVYSIGEERGVHFYAMQLIRGQTLADVIGQLRKSAADKLQRSIAASGSSTVSRRATTPQETPAWMTTAVHSPKEALYRSAARLGIQAAEALQYAHDQGVLHRDIKPSNLIVDREEKLYITDFGLARIEADAGMTMTGDLLGTLRYMAPEQALAKPVVIDHRADVYSLGATLYELFTLQPAFVATDRSELLKLIALDEPPPLRKLDRCIPPELETIVHKAMAKNRDERYQTAQRLADDLRAYLEHRPIKAQPPSWGDRVRKWSLRHQALVRAAGLAFVLLTAILVVSTAVVMRAQSRAVAALGEASDLLYQADMSLAYLTFEKGWSDEAERLLARHQPAERGSDRRGFEWYLLHSVVRKPASFALVGHEGSVNEIAAFQDGGRLASVGDDGTLRIWDLQSQKLLRRFQLGAEPLYSVAVSPDGRFVAAGSKAVYLCELAEGDQVREIFRSEDNIEALAFRADGARLAAGSRYHDVFLLTLAGELVGRTPCGSRVQSLEYVSKENQLLFPNRITESRADGVGVAQLWRDDLSVVQEQFDCKADHGNVNVAVARSLPDGQYILVGERYKGRAHLINRGSGFVVASAGDARRLLSDLAVAPNGGEVAISYVDGTIEYRQLRSRRGIVSFSNRPRIFQAHQGETLATRFVSADRLATCGADGLVKVWTLSDSPERAYDLPGSDDFQNASLSPEGALLLYTGANSCTIVDSSNGRVLWKTGKTAAISPVLAWAPTGNRFSVCLSSSHKRRLRIFNRIGEEISAIEPLGTPRGVAFSPSDQLVAIVGNQQLQLCNTESGEEIAQRSGAGHAVAFSHDGKWLAYGGDSDRIQICAIPGLLTQRELVHGKGVRSIAFSPDDAILAAGHEDGVVRLWDVATGHNRAEIAGHEHRVADIAFSPDGRALMSCDGVVRIWSVAHARSYGIFYDSAAHMSLSADGRSLAVGLRRSAKDSPNVLVWKFDLNAAN